MPEQDRTEEPTHRRREDARRRGQVARSVELNSGLVLLAFVGLASACALDFVHHLERVTGFWLSGSGTRAWSEAAVERMMVLLLTDIARLIAAPLLVVGAVILCVNLVQTQFLFSTQVLSPQFDRVNPIAGVRRLFSVRGLVEALRTGLKAIVIGWIAYAWIVGSVPALLGLAAEPPRQVLAILTELAVSLAWRIALVGLIFAAVDTVWQRRHFEQNLRMTRQDVRDEHRQNEGDPRMRARRRQQARRMSSARMLTMVPHADAVLTNPEHLAVALVYRENIMPAPRMLAKGGGDVAREIRDTARRFGIPVIENPPLARALYASTDVGQEIPKDLYEAVAHVMAYVLNLREGVTSR